MDPPAEMLASATCSDIFGGEEKSSIKTEPTPAAQTSEKLSAACVAYSHNSPLDTFQVSDWLHDLA